MVGYSAYRPVSPAGSDNQEDRIAVASPSPTAIESFQVNNATKMGAPPEARVPRADTEDSWRIYKGIPTSTTIPPFDFRHDHQPAADLHDPRITFDVIEDLDEEYPVLESDELRQLSVDFHPPKQLWKLLFKGFLRWIITAILIIIFFVVVNRFHSEPVMDNKSKKTFNFLVIGLSIALSLNVTSSLKAMTINIRWWLLSLRKRSLREVDLILHLDSLFSMTKLAFAAPSLAPLCIFWLLLNLVAQVGIAALGVTYQPDTPTNVALYNSSGLVYTPNLSQIFPERNATKQSQTIGAQQYTANNFGQIALSYANDDISGRPEAHTVWQASSPVYFYESKYFLAPILELNLNPDYDIVTFTNRSINSTWSCNSWPVISGGNGTSTNLTIMLDANGNTTSKIIPFAYGPEQTTYLTDTNSSCGPGCATVYAFEASTATPWWYECKITVSNVTNATLPEHEAGQNLTSMAAAAIALQGYASSINSSTLQYQYYPAASAYGDPQAGSASNMGQQIAWFSIGVVSAAIQWNPKYENPVPGDDPDTGVSLSVEWFYIYMILGLTGGGQLVLFILTSFLANLVVVKDDSHLSIARLLRPIVERLGPAGSNASGKAIAKALMNAEDRMGKVVYTVRAPSKGDRLHLMLGGGEKRLRAFPRGIYD